jgi:hypothetical protein
MRVTWFRAFCWRLAQALACIAIGALCCINVPLSTSGFGQTANASLWACVTTAALSLVFLKRSQ